MDRKDEGGVKKNEEEVFLSPRNQSAYILKSPNKNKRTAEQIEAIYSSGQNILVSASAGLRPLVMTRGLLTRFSVECPSRNPHLNLTVKGLRT